MVVEVFLPKTEWWSDRMTVTSRAVIQNSIYLLSDHSVLLDCLQINWTDSFILPVFHRWFLIFNLLIRYPSFFKLIPTTRRKPSLRGSHHRVQLLQCLKLLDCWYFLLLLLIHHPPALWEHGEEEGLKLNQWGRWIQHHQTCFQKQTHINLLAESAVSRWLRRLLGPHNLDCPRRPFPWGFIKRGDVEERWNVAWWSLLVLRGLHIDVCTSLIDWSDWSNCTIS